MMISTAVVLNCLVIVHVYAMDYPSPIKFFNQSDASKIVWSHRTNSQEALAKALNDSTMMIEADVSMGKLVGNDSGDDIPIMAHPPDTTSDLSLEDFLGQVKLSKNKKGIKLDFKNVEALEPSLLMVKKKLPEHDLPVMLNADILPGPVDETAPLVPADDFLTKCSAILPSATLSLGWTTNIPDHSKWDPSYGKNYTEPMKDLLQKYKISQPITFAVRAAMCQPPHEYLKELVNMSNTNTLTVWSVEEDAELVNYGELVKLRNLVGCHYAYFDMPEDQMDKFEDAMGGGALGITAALPVVIASLFLVLFLL